MLPGCHRAAIGRPAAVPPTRCFNGRVNPRLTAHLVDSARAAVPELGEVRATARGYALGWTARYQLIVIPTIALAVVGALTLPFSLAGVLGACAATIAAGALLYLALGRLRPPGKAPLRTNRSISLVATDDRLVILQGSARHRRLWRMVDHDDIDDAVLHRALVGLTHGGVIRVELLDGQVLLVEAPGPLAVDDLARLVDVIR